MSVGLVAILGSKAIANAIMHAIGSAIVAGLHGLLNTIMNGLLGVLTATTAINLADIARPDKALGTVVVLAAIPIVIVAVCQAVFQHNPKEAVMRGFVAPIATGVILLVSDALITGVLLACSAASWALVNLGLPGGSGYFITTWTEFATATAAGGAGFGAATGGAEGAVADSLAAVVMLVLFTILIAFTIWLELSLRAAVIYLLAAMVPIALIGLYWRRLTSWLVRLAEIIVAVALSQVVITMAMVLGTTLIGKSLNANSGGPGMEIANIMQGLGLLFLASLGLPLTLRLVPMAVDAAVHAGAMGHLRQGMSAAGIGSGASSAGGVASTPMSVAKRLTTAPVRAMQGFVAAGAPDAAANATQVGDMRRSAATGAKSQARVASMHLLSESRVARMAHNLRRPDLSDSLDPDTTPKPKAKAGKS